MLFSGARQGQGSHGFLNGFELSQLRAQWFHEYLILEIRRAQTHRLGQLDEAPGLGHGSPQGLFTNDPFELCSGLHGRDDFFHDRDAREVWGIDGDAIDVLRHLAEARVDPGLPHAEIFGEFHHCSRASVLCEPGKFHAAHLLHRKCLEPCDKTGSNDSKSEGAHILLH